MEWMNYHHLLYFYTVAREGSIASACKLLRLAQPTISGQIATLEDTLGEQLFERRGRGLVLTDVGRVVYRYADEIFSLGRELQDTLKGRPTGRPWRLSVGIGDMVPKLVASRLLAPAFSLPEKVRLRCVEDSPERLIAALAAHELDLVISDVPLGPEANVRAFNHVLGDSGLTVFGKTPLAKERRPKFPASLDGAPLFLPTTKSVVRRSLDHWFDAHDIRPDVLGEFGDSALLKAFGQEGHALFIGPTAIEAPICSQYQVEVVGRIDDVRERFYALSIERRIKNPAVRAITENARATFK